MFSHVFASLFARRELPIECECGETHNEVCGETGMRNHWNFPPFAYLPEENDIDTTYYATDEGGFMYTPIRHWALAGEIVDLNFFIRPRVTIETKFGEKVLVNFHLDASRAKFFNWTDLKMGRSMVILYAVNRTFMDSNNGIRQENPDTVMVFPTSLQKLMSEFQHHEAFEQNNTKECFSCGSPEIDEHKLMKCTSCKKAFYCNKECQQPHWKASHKHLCKHALMISKLAGLDFSTFNGFTDWSFPNIDPMTAEEKEARSKEMHRDALYRMGAAVGSVPDRLDELLSSIEGKNLEEVIPTSNMLRMLNEGDLPATAGETFIVESLRKFQAAISQDPKLREYVVDLSNQHGTDQRVHHMTSDTLLSMIFYILPLWQHEESVGAISWAFESHWPVSMFKGVYEDKSIWFTKGDYDSFLVKNRVADTSAFDC